MQPRSESKRSDSKRTRGSSLFRHAACGRPLKNKRCVSTLVVGFLGVGEGRLLWGHRHRAWASTSVAQPRLPGEVLRGSASINSATDGGRAGYYSRVGAMGRDAGGGKWLSIPAQSVGKAFCGVLRSSDAKHDALGRSIRMFRRNACRGMSVYVSTHAKGGPES